MTETDFKKQNASMMQEYELDDDAFEQLIKEKSNRARAYQIAFSKREEELVEYN